MINDELVSAVTWHLESAALSATEINAFRPPADSFQMRMHYSLYVTNLLSAADMVKEAHGESFESAIKDSLHVANFSGEEVLGYLRELRNGIVHRGIDPTAGGEVVDGVVCAIAPPQVANRSGNITYAAPIRRLADVFRHCDTAMKPVLERFLEPMLFAFTSVSPETLLAEARDALGSVTHMPDWAAELARENLNVELLEAARRHQSEKLRGLLRTSFGNLSA
ncbi:hypothetical protein ACYZTM_09520 [Pseudomonas sp. MDT2-39-1]